MNIFLGIIIIIIGIITLLNPEATVKWQHRWEFKKGAEPTEFAIIMSIIGSIFTIIVGFVFMFIPMS